jgi:hypothetical protein
MDINVHELREKPQINWLVPFTWMSKLTNEEIKAWEDEQMYIERMRIKSENRPISYDEQWNQEKIEEEVKARVRDKARIIEIDYQRVILQ